MLDHATALTLIDGRWNHFLALLESLDHGRWQQPTRLAGWTIADLASHVSWGVAMETDAVTKMQAGDPTPAGAEAIPSTSEPAELVAGLRERTKLLVEALRSVGADEMERAAPMPYGPTPFPFVMQVFAMEAAFHTDDLADAAGERGALTEEAITATMTVMGASLPVLAQASTEEAADGDGYRLVAPGVELAVARRDGGWVVGDAGERTTVIEGDPSTVTRFVMGRIPASDTRLNVRGDGPDAAMFKRHFPGP